MEPPSPDRSAPSDGQRVSNAALLSSGCATFGSVQRANTMGQGEWQFGIEPGVKGVTVMLDGSDDQRLQAMGDITFSFRAGISDRVDLGGRVGMNIYDLHMKYQITDPESTGPVLSFAPAVSVAFAAFEGAGAMVGYVNLPLLIGLPVGESQFIIGPRLVDYFMGATGGGGAAGGHLLFAGSSFAFAIRGGERFSLIPELVVAYPVLAGVAASGAGSTSVGFLGDGLFLEFKLGLVFGGQ